MHERDRQTDRQMDTAQRHEAARAICCCWCALLYCFQFSLLLYTGNVILGTCTCIWVVLKYRFQVQHLYWYLFLEYFEKGCKIAKPLRVPKPYCDVYGIFTKKCTLHDVMFSHTARRRERRTGGLTDEFNARACRAAYLDLAFGHAERVGKSSALGSGEVFGLFEGFFEREDLMPGERRARVLPAAGRRLVESKCRRLMLKTGDRWRHSACVWSTHTIGTIINLC